MARQAGSDFLAPIFVHSLFRAGSTYLFSVFRHSPAGYLCFQEPLNEIAYYARERPGILLAEEFGAAKMRLIRHPVLDRPYFKELHDVWPIWKDAVRAEAVYDGYFASPKTDSGVSLLRSLVQAANVRRPVIQECRTACRIETIKSALGGYHFYLWRNPWDQWWSYKVNSYFDAVNQVIIRALDPPAPVSALQKSLGLDGHVEGDLYEVIAHYMTRPLGSEASYLVFYMLWCLGLKHAIDNADCLLSIDRLSDSPEYRKQILEVLKDTAGIREVDFADCSVPQAFYLDEDKGFFAPLEAKVHECLLSGGWSNADLEAIQALREQYQPHAWGRPPSAQDPEALARSGARMRTLARQAEDTVAEAARNDSREVDAKFSAEQAEARAEQAEARAEQAEARAEQAESASNQALMALQAVYASISWRLTEPLRRLGHSVMWWRRRAAAAKPKSSPSVLRSAPRRAAMSLVRWSASYSQQSPRFRRFALRLLDRMPGMGVKLRQMHIASQLAPHPRQGDWAAGPHTMPGVNKACHSGVDADRPFTVPASDGPSASQRTPLEANFHAYRGNR